MLIIGIGGGTGSGKTTVVNQILSEFPAGEVQVISQDSYYKETSHLPLKNVVRLILTTQNRLILNSLNRT